jgi:hypothetical protein
MAASYAKLRDGTWGIRVDGTAAAGQSVTVSKRDGTTHTEVITRVVWAGNGVSLCAIAQREREGSTRSGSGSGAQRGHRCRNGHEDHDGPCCTGRHRGGDDCGADCCEMD